MEGYLNKKEEGNRWVQYWTVLQGSQLKFHTVCSIGGCACGVGGCGGGGGCACGGSVASGSDAESNKNIKCFSGLKLFGHKMYSRKEKEFWIFVLHREAEEKVD